MADVRDIQKGLNDQLKATNGVVNATSVFINSTEQVVDSSITEIRNYYLNPFDWFEENIEGISKTIQSKIDNNNPDIEINSSEIVDNVLPDVLPNFIKSKISDQLTPMVDNLVAQVQTGNSVNVDDVTNEINSLYNAFLKPLKNQIDNAISIVKKTIGGLLGTASITIRTLSKILTQDGPGIISNVGDTILKTKINSLPAGNGIIGGALDNLQKLGTGALFPNLDFLNSITSIIISSVTTLVTGISGLLKNVQPVITGIIGGGNISETIDKAVTDIEKISTEFQKTSESGLAKEYNTNTNAVENLDALVSFPIYTNNDLEKLNGAKVSLNSLKELESVIGTIHRDFKNKTTPTIRSWINLLRHIHPETDKYEDGLEYFKPFSDDIASRTLGYYTDTQSLDLEDWDSDYANSVRLNLKYKLDEDILKNINDSYKNLNTAMIKNLSTEFTEERSKRHPIGNIIIDAASGAAAHDYHIAGDSSYPQHLKNPLVLLGIVAQLLLLFGDSVRLIKYLFTISNYGKALDGSFTVNINDKDYQLNLKGNPYQTPIKAVDKSVLKP